MSNTLWLALVVASMTAPRQKKKGIGSICGETTGSIKKSAITNVWERFNDGNSQTKERQVNSLGNMKKQWDSQRMYIICICQNILKLRVFSSKLINTSTFWVCNVCT